MPDYGPSIRLTGLWKQTSKGGKTYLSGIVGGVKYLVFFKDDNQIQNDRQPVADLLISEMPREEQRPAEPRTQEVKAPWE